MKVLASPINDNKYIKIGKKQKMSVFADEIIACIATPRESSNRIDK